MGERKEDSVVKSLGIAISALTITLAACGSDKAQGPLDEVDAIVFIERQPRMGGMGDIFQYSSYEPGAKLVKLSPPTADGERTVICCDQESAYSEVDIIDFDVSFDAKSIVLSARLSQDQRYGLFLLNVDTGELEQLPTDPNADYVYPTFLPGDRILFATNAVVEEGAPQFRDEYERGVTLQLGTIAKDGSDEKLFARNLSHRITSTVLSSGEVLVTQWDHLNEMNAGQLLRMNPDGTRVREAFGKQGTGVTNSYYKTVEISPGRILAIGSSRDRTFQSGTILDIRLGETYTDDSGVVRADREMSEANASYQILTAQVPRGMEPSFDTVGRYYSAHPLNADEYPDLLVSWADGPVQSEVNGAAGIAPNFGIYLYDSEKGTRLPIYDAEDTWEINPQPLAPRPVPPTLPEAGPNQFSDEHVLLGAMNVYDSSIQDFAPGSIYGVRIVEGFSGEEGVGADFGLTRADGAATLGIAPIRDDGSWAALIPANVPVRQIAIDKYGMGLRHEPVWISGSPGESMFCGGCHESRSGTTVIEPGITDAIAIGPTDLQASVPRFDRVSTDYANNSVGVPWDLALQPIFDAKCVSCHDGDPAKAGNNSFTITDEEGNTQTFVFDLRGQEVNYGFGEEMVSGYSASHLSLLGPDMMDIEDLNLTVTGDMPIYVEPEDARGSILIQKINPPALYPTVNLSDRAFDGPAHPAELGEPELTPEEYRLLIEMVDNGGQFYSRENAPGQVY
jgi:hypothetical protein